MKQLCRQKKDYLFSREYTKRLIRYKYIDLKNNMRKDNNAQIVELIVHLEI